MPKRKKVAREGERPKPRPDYTPANNTVKLSPELEERVRKAMEVRGSTVKADFYRVAITNLCRETEEQLKARAPEEYKKIYGP